VTAAPRPLRMGVLLLEVESKGESGRDSGSGHLGTRLFEIQRAVLTSDKQPGHHAS